MLSLLRYVVRPPVILRPAVAVNFSTAGTNVMEDLASILVDEAKKHPTRPKPFSANTTNLTPRERQARRDAQILWKPFATNRFIRPHQLTYKSRTKPPRTFTRKPAVGPGSAEARYNDVFYQLGIDPVDQCQNPALLSSFVSEMGKIYGRHITGLTTRSQRRLGKAIRRAKMMGVIPILSKPPKSPGSRR